MNYKKSILFIFERPSLKAQVTANLHTLQASCNPTFIDTEEQFSQSKHKHYNYDALVFMPGKNSSEFLTDFISKSSQLNWIHTLSAGVDKLCANEKLQKTDHITLTNAKGAFQAGLAEFISLGLLYHTKKLEHFIKAKQSFSWSQINVEMVGEKTLAIVGYGDIGQAVAKIASQGFGMKVIGVKRNPSQYTEEAKRFVNEIVGEDQIERVLGEADFICNILPLTKETKDFFDREKFLKMKKTAVFMNIGRGATVVENDLIYALQNNSIAGAVLDVFEKEPLDQDNLLYSLPNVLMTPHCADQTRFSSELTFNIFLENLDKYSNGLPLINIVNKKLGY